MNDKPSSKIILIGSMFAKQDSNPNLLGFLRAKRKMLVRKAKTEAEWLMLKHFNYNGVA